MITRWPGQSIVFPDINSFFYISSLGKEDVDIGIVTPGKRYHRVLTYGLDAVYPIFPGYPEIDVIAFHTEARSEAHNDVLFSLKAPRELIYVKGEKILRDFEPSARFEEDGTLVLGQRRYRLLKEGRMYRAELL